MQNVAERAETPQRLDRDVDGVLRQQTGGLHLTAETGQDFLVEDRRRRPRQALVDDKTDRVRADIDDGNRRPVIEPAFGIMNDGWRALTRS